MAAGADVNVKVRSPAVLRSFAQFNCSVREQNNNGQTALDVATAFEEEAVAVCFMVVLQLFNAL